MLWNDEKLIEVLGGGGVVVIPTDTRYGIVGKADDASTVERIYKLRKRALYKPCIIMIADIHELEKFSIVITEEQKNILQKYWPGPVSIILDCPDEKLTYLHRGTYTLAFRIPDIELLRELLRKVGPLIAPSANREGEPSSENVEEARNYFGDSVDLYVDGGSLTGKASKIIKLHKDGSISIIRE